MVTADTEQDWNQHVSASVLVSFLFFCVALLGATLYLAQRKHSEYLWLSLLCLTVCMMEARKRRSTWDGWDTPSSAFLICGRAGYSWLRRSNSFSALRTVTGASRCALCRHVSWFFPCWLAQPGTDLRVPVGDSRDVFSVLVTVLLFRAWRKGRPDAGVMLLPFFWPQR